MAAQKETRSHGPRDRSALADRLQGEGAPLLLDGATGTELERAGLPTGLPLWSTHALLDRPEAVSDVHARYVAAGAEILTANTFRTQRRTLQRAGQPPGSDRVLTQLAVELARDAASAASPQPTTWVAGSLPPLEDCYAPDRVPSEAELAREHARQADLLAEAGADLILVETMNASREAAAAARAAAATGLPFLVSFVSWQSGRILSGEPLVEAATLAVDLGASATGVNCVPTSHLPDCLRNLGPCDLPLLVAPNLGEPHDECGFSRDESAPRDALVRAVSAWIGEPRLRVVGGCCGTTPEHIAALARALP